MRFAIFLYFSFFVTLVSAQDLVLSPIGEAICKPGVIGKGPGKGVVLNYGFRPDINMYSSKSGANDKLSQKHSSSQLHFKLKIPVLYKGNVKLLLGLSHYREAYDVSRLNNGDISILNNIHGKTLKNTDLSVYLIKPINHKVYVAFKGQASFNGDYDGLIQFNERYLKYNVGLIVGVKPRPEVEWGGGLLFRTSFTGTSYPVLPFGIYNRTFNEKWGIETVLPISIKARYTVNPKSYIFFGPEYQSRSYSLDRIKNANQNSLDELIMKGSEVRFYVEYQRQVTRWVWFNAQAGYSYNLNTKFTEFDAFGNKQPTVIMSPNDGVIFKFGLFLSPPKDKCDI